MLPLPESFNNQLKSQLGTTFVDFENALNQPPPISIRTNPFKIDSSKIETDKPVAWCNEGQYLTERPVFTLDPAFHAGAYYVQDASSMMIGWVVAQINLQLKPIRVLDLCAAPGGKSTLITSAVHHNSLVICNEVIRTRVSILKENMQKWGLPNVHITNHDPDELAVLDGFFDLILVDAPCSGEGLFRKDPKAIQQWSDEQVLLCEARQKRILTSAVKLLKPQGQLIYCTCTYNDSENQDNGQWLISHQNCKEIKLDIPTSWGVTAKSIGYQCYPHKVEGEGFYFSVFEKKSGGEFDNFQRNFKSVKEIPNKYKPELMRWLDMPESFEFYEKPNGEVVALLKCQLEELKVIDRLLPHKGLGLTMGTFKGQDFIPDHALALSTKLNPNLPAIALNHNEALQYLKKELLQADAPKGWMVVRYNGLALGWAKNIGSRINNYLPKDWRIRMEIPE